MTGKLKEEGLEIVQDFPHILQQNLKTAELLLKSNQFEDAALLYTHILQFIPNNHFIHHKAANTYRFSGDIEQSILHYKRAHELNSHHVNYYSEDISKDPLSFKKTIGIELSNLCNYSRIHTKCPLHEEKEPKIMATSLVKKIINELAEYGYKETLMFSVYNEPLIDPRLFLLLDYARKHLKDVKLHLLTNGFFLTQQIMDDLIDIGVNSVAVSAYTAEEFNRLRCIKSTIKYEVARQELDNRKGIYNNQTNQKNNIPCLVPIKDLIIGNDGSVQICCFDWRKSVVFGNVKEEKINDILTKPDYIEIVDNLRYGKPITDICMKCNIRTIQ